MHRSTQPRVRAYAAAAAALTVAASASADVVYTELCPVDGALFNGPNVPGIGPANGGNDIIIPIDFNQDGTTELEVSYEEAQGALNIKIQGNPDNAIGNREDEILVDRTAPLGEANNPLDLQFGEIIDATDNGTTRSWQFIGLTGPTFNPDASSSISGIAGSNQVGADGTDSGNFEVIDGKTPEYIGVRTIIDGEQHYGWIGIVITTKVNASLSGQPDELEGFVTGYAYESTPGVGLAAGVIPEPTSAAMLALGAAAFAARRR
ncbi:MAG: PEP-CTERM sorting domain-containing protein [Planctomycetota bacterium]